LGIDLAGVEQQLNHRVMPVGSYCISSLSGLRKRSASMVPALIAQRTDVAHDVKTVTCRNSLFNNYAHLKLPRNSKTVPFLLILSTYPTDIH